MTLDEYREQLKAIEEETSKKTMDLARRFAYSNSTHGKGDMIKGHQGWIKVEKVGIYFPGGGRVPSCIYSGPRYTAKHVPFKNGEIMRVYSE